MEIKCYLRGNKTIVYGQHKSGFLLQHTSDSKSFKVAKREFKDRFKKQMINHLCV